MKIETGEKVKAGFDFDRFQSQLSVAVVVCPYFCVSRLPSEKSFVDPKCFSSLQNSTGTLHKRQ